MELTKEIWTQSDYDEFAEYLKTLADEKYKKFSDSLVPGGTQSIGIRVPILRQTAKAISKGDYASFLNCKNNAYREEIMIKGLVMSLIKCDYHEMLGIFLFMVGYGFFECRYSGCAVALVECGIGFVGYAVGCCGVEYSFVEFENCVVVRLQACRNLGRVGVEADAKKRLAFAYG